MHIFPMQKGKKEKNNQNKTKNPTTTQLSVARSK